MKSKEEPNALKEEAEAVGRKRRELTEEGLEKVSGGISGNENGIPCPICSSGTWVVTVKK